MRLAAVFDEPAKGREGALHVWVNEIRDGKPLPQPRAYQLPYSKDLHALLGEAIKKTRQGVTQLGTSEPKYARRVAKVAEIAERHIRAL